MKSLSRSFVVTNKTAFLRQKSIDRINGKWTEVDCSSKSTCNLVLPALLWCVYMLYEKNRCENETFKFQRRFISGNGRSRYQYLYMRRDKSQQYKLNKYKVRFAFEMSALFVDLFVFRLNFITHSSKFAS